LLAALAAPERLRIVRLLADGERNVTQISAAADIAPLNVSHHLTVLKTAGLIRSQKRGRFVWYGLRPGVLEEAVTAGVPGEALNLGCCQIVLPIGQCRPDPAC
jgi:DNA-binding transcriptional ArsR family regulator